MKTTIDLNWLENMSFEADVNGHTIRVDAGTESGGDDSGARPKPLMLVALAGCTGMDVVSILKKMRVEYDKLTISVEANMREEHPKYYDEMKIIYHFVGKDLPVKKIERAVELSDEQYCGVSALYKMAIPLTSEIIITEK
ncbi:OsmC family protein [Plebeiibacterium sediminum]|uniref:OsmC family protein n=1 Tax=Plebeiibacterium sediminum TaxID=2992112 RepID=A0AAE3SEG9_9BACT|nr:OsmC family protein [Plebeiobacterium sediminum]MCW3785088.1 OsmC family protein [Plebeiobacterium sediminum]